MDSFIGKIHSFLRRIELWLIAVGESQPDDVDDLLLLGESLYRHLVGRKKIKMIVIG